MHAAQSLENREIQPLWNAAKLYWEELLNEKANIPRKDMNSPIKCLVDKYEMSSEDYNKAFFRYSCHLGSCAIRLYSIDELIASETRHILTGGRVDARRIRRKRSPSWVKLHIICCGK